VFFEQVPRRVTISLLLPNEERTPNVRERTGEIRALGLMRAEEPVIRRPLDEGRGIDPAGPRGKGEDGRNVGMLMQSQQLLESFGVSLPLVIFENADTALSVDPSPWMIWFLARHR
jgi:hypothetical protein